MARRSRARAALHAALQELEAGRQAEAIRHLITATWNLSRAEDSKPQKPSAPSPRESEPEVSPGDPAVDGGHRWETHTSPSGITEPCCVRCALAERAYRSGLDTKPCLMRANWNGWAPSPLREPEATTGCPTCGCTESDVRGVKLKCRNCERIFAPAPLATEGKRRIDETGTYRLTAPLRVSNLTTVATLPAGSEIVVTQVDARHGKVYGPLLLDWMSWDLPAEPAAPASRETGREG